MDQSSQKLKIKIGNAEFEAEGPTDLLKVQFERFMIAVERIGDRPAPIPCTSTAASSPRVGAGPTPAQGSAAAIAENSEAPSASPSSAPNPSPPADDLITRTFRRDSDAVSLLALPRSDDGGADALVLLLYGYQRLMGRSAVNGYTLIRAARQSGVTIPRVDVVLAKRGEYVLAAGAKRGRVYSLNNRGVAYAENVLRRTLE